MAIFKAFSNLIKSKKRPIEYARKIGVKIGENCRLLSTNFGTEPWLIEIGDHVEITGGVNFITHDGATWVIRDNERAKDVIKYGKIVIKDNCFIGLGSIILPGVTIGPNSIVAAGSVVTKDVEPDSVVAGNPAKKVSSVSDYMEKCIRNCPDYDKTAYKQDKKKEVLRILGNKEE